MLWSNSKELNCGLSRIALNFCSKLGSTASTTCKWLDGKPYRLGFYTLQNPTELAEQGELCPTEVIAHMNEFTLRKIGVNRDSILSEWRDPETKAEIEYFPY